MTSKAQRKREALAAWWARDPWPALFLAADPGASAGAALIVGGRGGMDLLEAASVDTYGSRDLEGFVSRGVAIAMSMALPLVLALEDWGAGGPRGLSQWVGLGEARGPWRREYMLRAREAGMTPRIVLVPQSRWRSRIVPETGAMEPQPGGSEKWRAFTPEEWKEAARSAAQDLFLDAHVPPADAAEAVCIGAFAARSDDAAKKLGKRHLKRHGYTFEPLEPTIHIGAVRGG